MMLLDFLQMPACLATATIQRDAMPLLQNGRFIAAARHIIERLQRLLHDTSECEQHAETIFISLTVERLDIRWRALHPSVYDFPHHFDHFMTRLEQLEHGCIWDAGITEFVADVNPQTVSAEDCQPPKTKTTTKTKTNSWTWKHQQSRDSLLHDGSQVQPKHCCTSVKLQMWCRKSPATADTIRSKQ